MSRILLVHWNAAEAEERARRLRGAGHTVEVWSDHGGAGLRAAAERPPEAFVIDLGRLPSHGLAAGIWLRQRRATRRVPIVFVGGDPDKVRRVRSRLPDAGYAEWAGIRGALRRAIARPPADPVVPGTAGAYSGTPLPAKLGIAAGAVVALLGAPPGFARALAPAPKGVRFRADARARAQVVLLFAKSRADLARRFPAAARALADRGGLWVAWPKKTSGVASDLAEPVVRAVGLGAGLVDNKVCAIDATWSGLRFARRRPAPARP